MYKVIDEGPNHVTLQHPMGHEVKIAKSALSKGMLNKVQKFARGGEINYGASQNNTLDEQKANSFKAAFNNAPDSNPKDPSKVENPAPKVVQKFADGTPEGGVPEPVPTSVEDASPVSDAPPQTGGGLSRLNPMNWIQPGAGTDAASQVIGDVIKHTINPFGSPAPGEAPIAQNVNQEGQGAQYSNVAMPAPTTPQDQALMNQQMAGAQQGIGMQIKGIKDEAQAQKDLGIAQVEQYKNQAKEAKTTADSFQTQLDHLNTEHDAFMSDYQKGHIDPNRFVNNMSAFQKGSTFLGLILGGMGGGGKSNMALDFLNQQINRDVESQKADLGKKENLLGFNMKEYGNLDAATKATQLNQSYLYEAKLKEMAAGAAGPLAQARAQQLMGPLVQQQTMMKAQLAAMNSGAMQNSPELQIRFNPMMNEKQKDEGFKELGTLQNMQKSGQNVMDSFQKVNQMALAGKFSPNARDALIEPVLAQLIKDAEGRITPADTPMIRALMPAADDVGNTRDIKKQKLQAFLSSKMNSPLLKAYGVRVPMVSNPGMSVPSTSMFKQVAMTR